MIYDISIHPAVAYGNYLYFCQFNDKEGELHTLLEGSKHGKYHKGEVPKGSNVKSINFTVSNRNRNFFEDFKVDTTKPTSDEYKNYNHFWLKAPNVKPPAEIENPNYTGHADLIIENITKSEENNVKLNSNKNKAYQKFMALDAEGSRNKRNVAFFFGVPEADKMTEEKLMLKLADFTSGTIMQPENIQRFLDYDSGDFLTQLSINTRRAIAKGYVETRMSGSTTTYYINNHPVGESEDGVISYLDSNRDFYHDYIVVKLGDAAEKQKKDNEKKAAKAEIIATDDLVALKATMKELFDKCKALGIRKPKVQYYDQIKDLQKAKDAIAEAEQLIEQNSTAEITT